MTEYKLPDPVLKASPPFYDGRDQFYTADQLREEVAKAYQAGCYALWTELVATPGTRVRKKSGSQWQGRVVGFYRTELTPDGVCVESEFHPGSVQIYPRNALEVIE